MSRDHGVNDSEDAVPCGSVHRLPFINTRIPTVTKRFREIYVEVRLDRKRLGPVATRLRIAVSLC